MLLLLIGLGAGALVPLEHTLQQERTPFALRARVFAAIAAAQAAPIPLGVLLAGFLIEAAGLRASLALYAVGNAVLALGAVLARGVRTLDRGTSFG